MAMGTVGFTMNLLGRRHAHPSRVVKTESYGQLEGEDRLEHPGPPLRTSSSSALLDKERVQSLEDGISTSAGVTQLLQPDKDGPACESPRASHDSILGSIWHGASDPSYSNRPSMNGCQGSPDTSFTIFGCNASSMPCCSARSSLDDSYTAPTSAPNTAQADMQSSKSQQVTVCTPVAVGVASQGKAGEQGNTRAPPLPKLPAAITSCFQNSESSSQVHLVHSPPGLYYARSPEGYPADLPLSPFMPHDEAQQAAWPDTTVPGSGNGGRALSDTSEAQDRPAAAAHPAAGLPVMVEAVGTGPAPPQPPADSTLPARQFLVLPTVPEDHSQPLGEAPSAVLHATPREAGQGASARAASGTRPLSTLRTSKSAVSVATLLQTLQQGAKGALGGGVRSQPATRDSSGDLDKLPMDVHGAYGCHIIQDKPAAHQPPHTIEDAIWEVTHAGRTNLDLLLEPVRRPTMMTRASLELQELLGPRMSLDTNCSRGGLARRSLNLLSTTSTASALTTSATGQAQIQGQLSAFSTPQQHRQLTNGSAEGSFVDLAILANGLPHAASTNMLGGLSAGEMLSCASPHAQVGGAGTPFGMGTTASAYASSVVDTSSGQLEDASDAASTPQELWLDPDLHDTFGAHALWPPAPAGGALGLHTSPSGPRSSGSPGFSQSYGSDPSSRSLGGGPAGSTSALSGMIPTWSAPSRANSAEDPIRPTSMLDPSTVHGQHSVTVQDPQHTVPSLQFLRARRAARQKLDQYSSSGGYIAEAKRVLSQAMSTADPLETLMVQSSHSGAIGPLLRHLSLVKHDDDALRAGLHTLSLIISNSPNKGIIISFKGQQMLFDILCTTKDLEVQQDIVQLLWDLESESEGSTCKDCNPDLKILRAFLCVLEGTQNATVASHAIHFMYGFRGMPMPGHFMAEASRRLVGVVAAYRYHLQDSAQYTLGLLLSFMLNEEDMTEQEVCVVAWDLLRLLTTARHTAQCQATLTLLSCVASSSRCRSALRRCQARSKLLHFGQHILDARLRARALSLVKVLNKQEQAASHQ